MQASETSRLSKLDVISFDRLLREQNPFGTSAARFDLRGVRLITSAALVQLAATCYALGREGRTASIILDDTEVRTYLVRSDFVRVVGTVARFEPPFDEKTLRLYREVHGSNPLLIEVTKIEKGSSLLELLDKIVYVLRHRLNYRKDDAFDIAMAVSEICQNTFDHNSRTCGFLAMQVYGRGADRFLEIGVADYGDGVRATLERNSKNLPINSDFQAIQKATRLGVSEHDDPTRGTGLYHLLELIYKHAGSVQIRSGSVKVRYRMDKRQGWVFEVVAMRGVQIALTLPTQA